MEDPTAMQPRDMNRPQLKLNPFFDDIGGFKMRLHSPTTEPIARIFPILQLVGSLVSDIAIPQLPLHSKLSSMQRLQLTLTTSVPLNRSLRCHECSFLRILGLRGRHEHLLSFLMCRRNIGLSCGLERQFCQNPAYLLLSSVVPHQGNSSHAYVVFHFGHSRLDLAQVTPACLHNLLKTSRITVISVIALWMPLTSPQRTVLCTACQGFARDTVKHDERVPAFQLLLPLEKLL
jgi:hypothetical protein